MPNVSSENEKKSENKLQKSSHIMFALLYKIGVKLLEMNTFDRHIIANRQELCMALRNDKRGSTKKVKGSKSNINILVISSTVLDNLDRKCSLHLLGALILYYD